MTINVDLYQAPPSGAHGKDRNFTGARPQRWRWRARNADNNRILAQSSEAYTNKTDALAAIHALFGLGSDVYLRETDTAVPSIKTLRYAAPT